MGGLASHRSREDFAPKTSSATGAHPPFAALAPKPHQAVRRPCMFPYVPAVRSDCHRQRLLQVWRALHGRTGGGNSFSHSIQGNRRPVTDVPVAAEVGGTVATGSGRDHVASCRKPPRWSFKGTKAPNFGNKTLWLSKFHFRVKAWQNQLLSRSQANVLCQI